MQKLKYFQQLRILLSILIEAPFRLQITRCVSFPCFIYPNSVTLNRYIKSITKQNNIKELLYAYISSSYTNTYFQLFLLKVCSCEVQKGTRTWHIHCLSTSLTTITPLHIMIRIHSVHMFCYNNGYTTVSRKFSLVKCRIFISVIDLTIQDYVRNLKPALSKKGSTCPIYYNAYINNIRQLIQMQRTRRT